MTISGVVRLGAVLSGVSLPAITARAAAPESVPRPAEMVLVNGAILTFQGVERNDGGGKPKFVEAAAVSGGRFVFLGRSKRAERFVGPATQVIDLEGRMVMPGIVDGHFHGTRLTDCEMGYAGGTIAQVLAKLQACLDRPDQAAFKNTNVRLQATHIFGEAIEPEGTALTRYDLDKLDTTRPVSVRNADGHKFWMNSKAIENAKIDENTPDPPDGE